MNISGIFSKMICDGVPVEKGTVHLSPHSRIAAYGEGCFDTLRAYRGGFIRPEHHLERLHRGMRYLGLEIPEVLRDRNAFLAQLKRLLEVNDRFDEEVRIRIQVWADDHTAGYRPGNRSARFVISGTVIASGASAMNNIDSTSDTFKSGDFKNGDNAAVLVTSRYHRISTCALPSDVKWTNGINYILAAREAAEKNADDALMLTPEGYVSESTIANIFWKIGETVFTPSKDCDLLPGVTRAMILEALLESGIPVKIGKFQPEDLMKADTVWLCNSIREWFPVSRIDNHQFVPDKTFWGTICDLLQRQKKQEMYYVR